MTPSLPDLIPDRTLARTEALEGAAVPPAKASGARPWRGATAQSMRSSNRLLLLHLIRDHAPISRPRLAELSGIHRSNVTLIADALVGEGLVEELAGSVQGRGRVASLLRLRVSRPVVLGISVRPAETTGLLARLDGTTERLFRFASPDDPRELLQLLRTHTAAVVRRGKRSRPVEGLLLRAVLAVPGRMLPAEGLWMPDFPLYRHFPLAEELGAILKTPVLLVNGGNVAAVAAMRVGSEEPTRNLAFVAVHESGVGGGIIADGRLYSGYDGTFAGEFGHMIVSGEGPRCACGAVGCWGELISDRAVWARLAAAAATTSSPRGSFSTAAYRELLARAQLRPGSRLGEELNRCLALLLAGLRNIVMTLNPQQVVLAGEITGAWDALARHPLAQDTHPEYWSKLEPASAPLSELYELGTVQHGLQSLFEAGEDATLPRHVLRSGG